MSSNQDNSNKTPLAVKQAFDKIEADSDIATSVSEYDNTDAVSRKSDHEMVNTVLVDNRGNKTDEQKRELMNPWDDVHGTQGIARLKDPRTNELETLVEQNNRLESEHFYRVYHSILHYASWQFNSLQSKHYDFLMLSPKYQFLAKNFLTKLKRVRSCILENQKFFNQMCEMSLFMFLHGNNSSDKKANFVDIDSLLNERVSSQNMDKVESTLKQIVRDWSEQGKKERELCYNVILDKLNQLYPNTKNNNTASNTNNNIDRSNIRILNPGCGLGRLPWEIAKQGFEIQGNEFSYFMLICSHFILNQCENKNMYKIYPYCCTFNNNLTIDDQTQSVLFPDISPFDLRNQEKQSLLSMVAGDFIECYGIRNQFNQWDCIVSCFFLDTAHNILEFIEIFACLLKIGGYIINFGPLLYHFESMEDPSLELTNEELLQALPSMGFEIVESSNDHTCLYTTNRKSMLQTTYNASFWVARKVKNVCPIHESSFDKPKKGDTSSPNPQQ